MAYSTENIRNLVLVGQQGSGKTSLMDEILYHTGVITKPGTVEEGNTVGDYDWLEKQRGFTINPALCYTTWRNTKINLVDTPGFPDFVERLRPILQVAEVAIIVSSADTVTGSEVQRVARHLKTENLARLVFVNKTDTKLDLQSLAEAIQEHIGMKLVLLAYPLYDGDTLVGIVDLVNLKTHTYQGKTPTISEISDDNRSLIEELHERLVETVAETSDELIEKYLEEGELSPEEISQGLRAGIASTSIVPVLAGSTREHIGIDLLLNTITASCPSPAIRETLSVTKPGEDEPLQLKTGASEPICAQVFLSLFEPHLGEVSAIKVFAGTLTSGSTAYNANHEDEEKIGQIYLMCGNKREETPQLVTGDIGVLTKLKNANNGDTFCLKSDQVVLPVADFPQPNTSIALKSREEKDEQRLSAALSRLTKADPLLKVTVDKESGQTILSGMGEVHLDLTIQRMKQDFNIEVETEEPEIPYRETVTTLAKAQGKYKKQSGGRGQYGDVWLSISPLPQGEGFQFVDQIKGGVVPNRFIPSVEKGVKEAMKKGNLAGYPMVDFEAALFDGSYHSVDSSDIAFQVAASMALRKAVDQAAPILLEPIMELEIDTPSEFMGEVNGDLSSRRGRILEIQPIEGADRIRAQAPRAELRNYSTTLRSITQGRGLFRQKFSHYERVPDEAAQKVIENRATKKEG